MTPESIKLLINQSLAYLGKRFESIENLIQSFKKDAINPDFIEASKQLSQLTTLLLSKESNSADIAQVLSGNVEVFKDISRSMEAQSRAVIAEIAKKGTKESKAVDLLIENGAKFKLVVDALQENSASMKVLADNKQVQDIASELKVSMSAVVSAIKAIEIKAPEVKFEGLKGVESLLERIDEGMNKISLSEVSGVLREIVELLKKKPEAPKTVKFDADQFRELRALMGQKGGPVVVGGALGGGLSSASTLKSGRMVVAVTNTAIAIGTAACQTVFITALTTNSGIVVVGGNDVVATEATRTGKVMYPGDTITISIDNLAKIFINGTANDGVSFTYTR